MDCGLRVAVLKEVTTSVVARMLSSKWTNQPQPEQDL